MVKSALKNVKKVAQTATTVIGTVASEIAGEQVLKPNSAPSMVTAALGSANKSKQLAKRIYYSFCPSYRSALLLEDISRCFQNREQADTVSAQLGANLPSRMTTELTRLLSRCTGLLCF